MALLDLRQLFSMPSATPLAAARSSLLSNSTIESLFFHVRSPSQEQDKQITVPARFQKPGKLYRAPDRGALFT